MRPLLTLQQNSTYEDRELSMPSQLKPIDGLRDAQIASVKITRELRPSHNYQGATVGLTVTLPVDREDLLDGTAFSVAHSLLSSYWTDLVDEELRQFYDFASPNP